MTDVRLDSASDSRLRPPQLVVVAGIFASGAGFVALSLGRTQPYSALLLAVGTALCMMALIAVILPIFVAGRTRAELARLAVLVESDFLPSLVTDPKGTVVSSNRRARQELKATAGVVLPILLADGFGLGGGTFRRLLADTLASGETRQDLARADGHMRISARLTAGHVLWRFEEIAGPRIPDLSEMLPFPALSLGPGDTVLHSNEAMRKLIGKEKPALLSEILEAQGHASGQVGVLRGIDGPRRVHVEDISQAGARMMCFLPVGDSAGTEDLDVLPVPVLRLGRDGRIAKGNRLAAQLLGKETLSGCSLATLVEGLGRPVDEWLRDVVEGRAPVRPEILRASCRSEETYLQISLRPFTDADGAGALAVLNDATELKTLEAQFVQSQKMQAIGQLAGGIAHDFNNLLTAISGHCDLLLLRHSPSDPDFGELIQISQNANRAASLVGQLMAFSRKQSLTLEPLDLRETLADMTHLLNRLVGEPIRLTLVHDPGLLPVRGDKRQIEQVVMNLVVNARDAMPDGGEISIRTRMRCLDQPETRDRVTMPAGDYVIVSVEDEGLGIAPDKIGKIFEPFFTTKKPGEGTGLGLSTAYGIVKQSGGYIFAESDAGHGARFYLYFPAVAPGQGFVRSRPETRLKPSDATRKGKILLVEDEAPVRSFAARALSLRGHEVIEAASGEEALDVLSGGALNVDVVVTDVVMPGLDGPAWVAQALATHPDMRVVFVSGYSEESLIRQRSEIPNAVFLPKPFSLVELTQTVQQQLCA